MPIGNCVVAAKIGDISSVSLIGANTRQPSSKNEVTPHPASAFAGGIRADCSVDYTCWLPGNFSVFDCVVPKNCDHAINPQLFCLNCKNVRPVI
jgi:hypothetical protein